MWVCENEEEEGGNYRRWVYVGEIAVKIGGDFEEGRKEGGLVCIEGYE